VVDRLRPGLTQQQVDQISAEFGVRLSQDAATLWMWHDGERLNYEGDWRVPSLTPCKAFCSLRASLQRSAHQHELTWDEEAFDDPVLGGPDSIYLTSMFDRQYVILFHNDSPVVMNCEDPDAPNSPTGSYGVVGGLGATISLTERICWWRWALDNGCWSFTADGTWDVDDTRLPGQLIGLHVRDNAE
ncbi:MAG: hypothetical protein HGA44_10480, partial [Cellulomonadaceae bacterium]|nr:hypothetical protein [Cellulomonadaceae bacterium]